MGFNIKSLGKSALGAIDNLATPSGELIGKGLRYHNIVKDAARADKIGKITTYGAMGGAVLGAAINLDEYQYGFGNGLVHGVGGTLGGAGLGAVGTAGAMAVATAIAKGIR